MEEVVKADRRGSRQAYLIFSSKKRPPALLLASSLPPRWRAIAAYLSSHRSSLEAHSLKCYNQTCNVLLQ